MGRRHILSRDRLEAPPPPAESVPTKPSGFRVRRAERRWCPGCRHWFSPVRNEQHCSPSHRLRAFWRRTRRSYHKGKPHSVHIPVSYPPQQCAIADCTQTFVPRSKREVICASCRAIPRHKRRSRRKP